ncbi:MAG: acyltransferase family protein [Pyrinomonadaceae bacterium]
MSQHVGPRLVSLDVFRGMTIAAMVLVNNPGGSPVYWPLDHAEWNGLTPTDWIFPFFLFIIGVAIPISLGRNAGVNERAAGRSYAKIVLRSVSIFLLGLAISVIPFFQFTTTDAPDLLKMLIWLAFAAALFFLLLRKFKIAGILAATAVIVIVVMNIAGNNVVPYNFGMMRVFGVLQRIAICYLIASFIFLHTNWKQQLGIAVAILLGYWLLMTTIPVPVCDITTFNDKACNLAAYIDRLILGENHIWRFGKVYDPEGILSTLPAIATTLSGVLTGIWLMRRVSCPHVSKGSTGADGSLTNVRATDTVSGIFFFGAVMLGIGLIWNSYFPMNKSLWTSSYVATTTGIALLVFGSCYWLIDIKGYKKWAWPFVIFGVNALALFVFSGIFGRMISAYKVIDSEGKSVSIQRWIVDNIFLIIFDPINASLAYAISFILFWFFLMWLLYRKRFFIKV